MDDGDYSKGELHKRIDALEDAVERALNYIIRSSTYDHNDVLTAVFILQGELNNKLR